MKAQGQILISRTTLHGQLTNQTKNAIINY